MFTLPATDNLPETRSIIRWQGVDEQYSTRLGYVSHEIDIFPADTEL